MKIAVLLSMAALGAALPVWAALGDTVESVASDQKKFQARIKVSQLNAYSVHEMTTDNGIIVNEYVSPAGKVFAVSWKGPVIPDLSQLLGTYFPEFQSSVRGAKVRNRRSAVVRNTDLIVESSGRMRDFTGRAYLHSLLPSGVDAEVIQ
jgi:Protein of unknown function (DUF2844)